MAVRKKKSGKSARPAGADVARQLREARAQQAATARILKVIARSPSDVQPAFEAIVASAKKLLGGFSAAAARVEGEMVHLAAFTSTGRAGDAALRALFPQSVAKGAGNVGHALRKKAPYIIEDIERHKGIGEGYRKAAKARGYRAALVVPMMRKGEAIGTISVTRVAAGPFAKEHVELLQTFADQAVIAIENARRFNDEKEALKRQTATAEILNVISRSSADVQPVFGSILENAIKLCSAQMGILGLYDGKTYRTETQRGANPRFARWLAKRGNFEPPPYSALGRMLATRRPVHIADMAESDGYRKGWATSKATVDVGRVRTYLAVPLLKGDRVIGGIAIYRSEVQPFTDKQVELLDTFASQAVIAIENVRQFNETREALERQTATAEILNVIARSPSDVQPVVDAIARSALRLLGGRTATVRKLENDHLALLAYTRTDGTGDDYLRGQAPISLAEDVNSGLTGAVKTGKPTVLLDTQARGLPPRLQEASRIRGWRSALTVPMKRDGIVTGTISVTRAQPGDFSKHEVELLQTFADQAVIAIQNVRLFNETREALERQTATSEVLRTISRSTFDLEAVLQVLIENATRLAGANQGFIFRFDGEIARLAYSYNAPPEYRALIEATRFSPGRGSLVSRVLLERRPVHLPDALADSDFTLHDAQRLGGFRSMLGVPMLREGNLIGVIAMWTTEVRPFTDKQIELVSTFADQAVIAIENVRLFNETKQALERQTATAEILKVMAGSPADVQPVFDAIASSATQLCEASFCIVFRFDGATINLAADDGRSPGTLDVIRAAYPAPPNRRSFAGRAILERQVVSVADAQSMPDNSEQAERARAIGYRSILAVPMMKRGTAIGSINVARLEVNPFTEAQVELMKAFADQAVIAIENVRLFNETKEALERQTATAEILKVIASSPSDVQPVFDAIAASAMRLLGGLSGSVTQVIGDMVHLSATTSTSQATVDRLRNYYPRPLASTKATSRVLRSGKPEYRSDYESDPETSPDTRELARVLGFRSNLWVPLLRDGVAFGTINVARAEAGPFSDHQINLLETFADQAVIAIENVRLFNETKEALERQTATAEILKVIAGSPSDVQPVFDAIARSAAQLFGREAGLRLVEAGGLRRRAWSVADPTEFHGAELIPLDENSLIGRAVLQAKAMQLADTTGPGATPYARANSQDLKWRAIATAPLLRGGAAIGTISVTSPQSGALSDKQMELLTTFADQAVIAIENVRLFNETKEALERQTATADILKVIASSPADVKPVFDAILRSAVNLCGAEIAAVFPYDGKLVHLGATHNWSEAALKYFSGVYPAPPSAELMSGRTILSKSVVRLADAAADEHYDPDSAATGLWRRMLGVPMLREGQPLGALVVCWREPGETPPRQVDLLQTFADQAVIAIENVRLFNETKESLERQTATAEILKVIASSPSDVQPVFDAIAEAAVRLIGGLSATVTRISGDKIHLVALTSTGKSGDEALRATFPRPIGEGPLGKAIASRAPAFRVDTESETDTAPEMREMARARGYRSLIAVPMLRDSEPIGAIAVTRAAPGAFSRHQMELLGAFADQAVIAIENVRLFRETRDALERQTATAEILKVIASSPNDVQPVFDVIVKSAVRLCGARFGRVYRYDGSVVQMVAGHGLSSGGLTQVQRVFPRPATDDTIVGRVIVTRQPYFVRDIDLDKTVPELSRQMIAALNTRSQVTMPMLRAGEPVGAITMGWDEPGAFTEQQVVLLQTFADQAVIAIENVRLFNETKESLERQTATAEVLKVIASSPSDVQPVFDAIAASARRLLDANAALVARRAGDMLELAAYTSTGEAADAQLRKLFPSKITGQGHLGKAVLSGAPVGISDILNDPNYSEAFRASVRARGLRSLVSVPMMREGEAIGVISVNRTVPGQFSEHQTNLLKTFADQAVIAIENVRLFNETKESLERQTATAEILEVISSSPTDLQPVFEAILQKATSLCEAHLGSLGRYDGVRYEHVAHRGATPEFVNWLLRGPFVPSPDSSLGRMVLGGKPTHTADLRETERYRSRNEMAVKTVELGGARTNLAVPMIRDGKVVGGITIYRREVRPFTERQINLVSTFANQAVIAIENARLFNETKEALERQTATAEILKVISQSTTDVQPALEAIVGSAAKLFPQCNAFVFMRDGDLVRLHAMEGATVDARLREDLGRVYPVPFDPAVSTSARAMADRRPNACADTEAPEVAEHIRRAGRAARFRSNVVVPLVRDDEGIGTIVLTDPTPGHVLAEKQLALLQTFADQAVIAIENVRLFNETKESLERQTATAEILKVIASSPSDVQPVFDAIVATAKRLIGAFSATVTHVGGGKLHLVAHTATTPEGAQALNKYFPIPVEGTPMGRAVLLRRPEFIDDFEADTEEARNGRELARSRGFRSVVFVPLMRGDAAIGSLNVTRREAGRITDHQLDLLKTFADQAVIAIENVRLFNETKEALEQQTATAGILKVISESPTDTQPVFEAIVQSGLKLFPNAAVAVTLPDGNKVRIAAIAARDPALAEANRARFPTPMTRDRMHATAILDGVLIDVPDAEAARGGRYGPGVENFLKSGNRALTIMPMMCGDVAIGTISVVRTAPGPLSEKQIALLRTFAAQAVIAIENVRTFKELEARTGALTRSVKQLTALGEVGQAISSTLDLETVLKTIVERAVQLTGLDGGSIYEYDESSQEFQLRAAQNLSDEIVKVLRETPMRKGEGTIGHAVETGEPTEVPDMLDDSYQSPRRDTLIQAGYRALLVVPLRREEHIIGALAVNRKEPGHFPHDVVELLKTFATQSAMAIQNARLFREIAEKGRELEVASRHKSDFLASMSHELRTPLNAILGFNEMILSEVYGAVPGDMQEPLKDIQTSGKHLLRLINNVLDLAKIEAGRMELSLSDYSVQDTVESVRATLRPLAAEKGLEFLAQVPADLPLAHGDAGRIAQCLMNLAGNSLKFTKQGKVEIAVEQRDGLLRYSVADTGIGIPPDKIGSLFTEFKQTDATIASEYGGTGLGLSISKKFVEMQGGRIWIESELGRGSTFIFEIPIRVSP